MVHYLETASSSFFFNIPCELSVFKKSVRSKNVEETALLITFSDTDLTQSQYPSMFIQYNFIVLWHWAVTLSTLWVGVGFFSAIFFPKFLD